MPINFLHSFSALSLFAGELLTIFQRVLRAPSSSFNFSISFLSLYLSRFLFSSLLPFSLQLLETSPFTYLFLQASKGRVISFSFFFFLQRGLSYAKYYRFFFKIGWPIFVKKYFIFSNICKLFFFFSSSSCEWQKSLLKYSVSCN